MDYFELAKDMIRTHAALVREDIRESERLREKLNGQANINQGYELRDENVSPAHFD